MGISSVLLIMKEIFFCEICFLALYLSHSFVETPYLLSHDQILYLQMLSGAAKFYVQKMIFMVLFHFL